jgi:hypothetical protein
MTILFKRSAKIAQMVFWQDALPENHFTGLADSGITQLPGSNCRQLF